jgi:dUTP pyrophosphatase
MAAYLEGTTCYLAHPIDYAGQYGAWTQVKQDLLNLGALVFDPKEAFGVPDISRHSGIMDVCRATIETVDFMVAVSPETPGIGTAMEIEYARTVGLPTVVLSMAGTGSWALAGTDAMVSEDDRFGVEHADWVLAQLAKPSTTFRFNRPKNRRTTVADYVPDVRRDIQRAVDMLGHPAPVTETTPELGWTPTGVLSLGPTRGYQGDAGWDLYVSEEVEILAGQTVDVPCGVRLALPDRVWGLVIGRSSAMRKERLLVHTSVIDTGYRGDMFVLVENRGPTYRTQIGQRLAQLVPLPNLAMGMDARQIEHAEFEGMKTDRGTAGFGSSGQ